MRFRVRALGLRVWRLRQPVGLGVQVAPRFQQKRWFQSAMTKRLSNMLLGQIL